MNYEDKEAALEADIKKFTMGGIPVPTNLVYGMVRYIMHGSVVGDFLTAVITNDLGKAMAHADDQSLKAIRTVYGVFYNLAPIGCFGSEEKMRLWMEAGGLLGINKVSKQES